MQAKPEENEPPMYCVTCGAPNGNCEPEPHHDGIVVMTLDDSHKLRTAYYRRDLRGLTDEQLVEAVLGPDYEFQGNFARNHRTEILRRMKSRADLLAALKVAKQFFINPGSFNPLDVERMYDAAIARAEEV